MNRIILEKQKYPEFEVYLNAYSTRNLQIFFQGLGLYHVIKVAVYWTRI